MLISKSQVLSAERPALRPLSPTLALSRGSVSWVCKMGDPALTQELEELAQSTQPVNGEARMKAQVFPSWFCLLVVLFCFNAVDSGDTSTGERRVGAA